MLLLIACAAADDDKDDSAEDPAIGDAGVREDRYFPDGALWYRDISDAPADPDSESMIAALDAAGWGLGRLQIDFSFEILDADATTPRENFEPTADFYTPDCDETAMPLPDGGNLEGETGYACDNGGDCHLIVVDRDEERLYEMWRADIRGEEFSGGCLAVWDMTQVYPDEGRGEQCTSADAAGYPIAPLLFTADEVASGVVDHAIRFALPNASIRDGEYFHPASHATDADGGGAEAIPYGARLRLGADFDTGRISDPDAQVLVRTLQTYGMVLADGGNVALMGESDERSTAKWAELFEDYSHALVGIEPADFEVLELDGPAIPLTFACERNGM